MNIVTEVITNTITCPRCHNDMTELKYIPYYHWQRQAMPIAHIGAECHECGYAYAQSVTTRETDIENDVGRVVFKCLSEPFGCAILTHTDSSVLYLPIDIIFIDSFVGDLRKNIGKGLVASVVLSYLKDNEIKKVELLDLL